MIKDCLCLGSVLPTHGLAYANSRHRCVKYSVNLLYDIPTLVKEGKSMVKSMISSPFPHHPFLLILNGVSMHDCLISDLFEKRWMYWGNWETKCAEKGLLISFPGGSVTL